MFYFFIFAPGIRGYALCPFFFLEGPKAALHHTKKVSRGMFPIGSHAFPDFISGWGKSRIYLPPKRGENNERYPIATGKKVKGHMVQLAGRKSTDKGEI
jgi:hypothetical protein